MRRVTAVAFSAAALAVAGPHSVFAAGLHHPPVHCQLHNNIGQCVVTVGAPGSPGGGGGGSGAGGSQSCVSLDGQTIPCTGALGTWDSTLGCYVKLESPQPPKSDPIWQGHRDGAIYNCSSWPATTTGVTQIWLQAPVTAVDPRTVALQAERSLRLPQPSGYRSPRQTLTYDGSPFTYVNLWTWFWTSPGSWQVRTATASAGGMSATVSVRPVSLTFDPGDGSSAVLCGGSGRAWTKADGDRRPSGGGCGFRYLAASSSPVSSTQSIRWAVSWRASDGASGQLPDLTTSRTGELMVLQIESVVSR
jgi:hypothetical protein